MKEEWCGNRPKSVASCEEEDCFHKRLVHHPSRLPSATATSAVVITDRKKTERQRCRKQEDDQQADEDETRRTIMMADSVTDSEASAPSYNPKRPFVTWLNHEDGSSGEYTPVHHLMFAHPTPCDIYPFEVEND
jgi:hypothetical protein